MARMHNPPHPGETLKEDVLPDLGLTITEAARQLGVSRQALSRVLDGRAPITAELAVRLAKWLGGEPDIWLRVQNHYDLWHAEQDKSIEVMPVVRTLAA
ncbi:HigA family addiction module antitoxin [Massilia terrae]|uniref:HigA family addiction module antitoxin n=1 Tax=Massilia terrae TaxID=1811224 RepID=A0ABT2CZE6_9BURK|nr:HigA family addiction module antitoxin [Massilia terrae]MCS0659351.1 HigA family addiction module antitoxin [Massilia terrae]